MTEDQITERAYQLMVAAVNAPKDKAGKTPKRPSWCECLERARTLLADEETSAELAAKSAGATPGNVVPLPRQSKTASEPTKD